MRKIATMATSTENFASKVVELLNAELTEHRKQYQEAVSKRSDLKRKQTTAEGMESHYRGKASRYRSEYNTKAGMNILLKKLKGK